MHLQLCTIHFYYYYYYYIQSKNLFTFFPEIRLLGIHFFLNANSILSPSSFISIIAKRGDKSCEEKSVASLTFEFLPKF